MVEYDTFLLRNETLAEGQECRITIRDLAPGKHKYEAFPVRAVLSRSAEQLPSGEILWVRTALGRLWKDPWRIQILARLDNREGAAE